jgi:hypothetical protein
MSHVDKKTTVELYIKHEWHRTRPPYGSISKNLLFRHFVSRHHRPLKCEDCYYSILYGYHQKTCRSTTFAFRLSLPRPFSAHFFRPVVSNLHDKGGKHARRKYLLFLQATLSRAGWEINYTLACYIFPEPDFQESRQKWSEI